MWIQESETNEDGNVCDDLHDAFSLRQEFVDMLLRNQSQNVVDEKVDVRYQQGQVIPGREVTVASWLGLVKDALFLKRPYNVVCCAALFCRMEKVLVENFGVILKLRHHMIGDAIAEGLMARAGGAVAGAPVEAGVEPLADWEKELLTGESADAPVAEAPVAEAAETPAAE